MAEEAPPSITLKRTGSNNYKPLNIIQEAPPSVALKRTGSNNYKPLTMKNSKNNKTLTKNKNLPSPSALKLQQAPRVVPQQHVSSSHFGNEFQRVPGATLKFRNLNNGGKLLPKPILVPNPIQIPLPPKQGGSRRTKKRSATKRRHRRS